MLHPNWPFGVAYTVILYNLFCVLSFHTVLCVPDDYHIVKEETWNINDLKNINYNKVNELFFLSVLQRFVLELPFLGCVSTTLL